MPPGRSQVRAMQRLAQLLAVLDNAGTAGVTADRLVDVADYSGDPKHLKDQLSRDLRLLRTRGWQIDNVAAVGVDARYRLLPGDNRLRVGLSEKQLAALHRAVILARRTDLAGRLGVPPGTLPAGIGVDVVPRQERPELSLCHQAVQLRSRVTFTYKGTVRSVHPGAVRFQNYRWFLSGVEDGFDVVKHFVVAELRELALDAPGSAADVPEVGRIPLHPLRWAVDPPTEVTVRTEPGFVSDVRRWLMAPTSQVEHDGVVDLHYTVTNRAGFRARVYILGPRVRITAPAEMHNEIIDELRTMAGF